MKKAFTLIELVMVIVIIGMLAVVAIPKYSDLRQKAINASEREIMVRLYAAIRMKYAVNIASGNAGPKGTYWPCQTADEDPFSLLSSPPPYILGTGAVGGGYWGLQYNAGGNSWKIYCPHSAGAGSKFNMWQYFYAGGTWAGLNFPPAGSVVFTLPTAGAYHSTIDEASVMDGIEHSWLGL